MTAPGKVVVAMSGGVDSSVAAALLVEQGYEVLGMTMRVTPGEDSPKVRKSCCSLEDVDDARHVAEILGIPFYALALEEDFREKVIGNFVSEYLAGRTPNPCMLCNTDLKFGALLDRARALGAEKVATGHYVRLGFEGRWQLRQGLDDKDQSYALYGLTQTQLAHALFPLGNSTKAEVRELARRFQLPVEAKPDSQDICFVPGGDYRDFLARQVGDRIQPGDFVDSRGSVLGTHRGVPFYTIGQRRGLGLQGHERKYVVQLDPETNQVRVGSRHEAMRHCFRVHSLNWVSIPEPEGAFRCQARLRHGSSPVPAEVIPQGGDALRVVLDSPDPGISPGQACVLYQEDLVLGGGIIQGVEV